MIQVTKQGRNWRALAWTLVYALVLQLVLTSAFAASAIAWSPADGSVICRGDTGASAPDDHGTAPSVPHCPLCLSRSDVADLPPPPPALAVPSRSHAVVYVARHVPAPVVPATRPAHQPRAPPGI